MNHRNLIQYIYGVVLYLTCNRESTVWIGHISCVLIASDLMPHKGGWGMKSMEMKNFMKIQWHGLDCLVNKSRGKRNFNAIVTVCSWHLMFTRSWKWRFCCLLNHMLNLIAVGLNTVDNRTIIATKYNLISQC